MKVDRRFFGGVLSIAIGLGLLSGCSKKDDPVNQAAKKDVAASVPDAKHRGIKAIAEEGFIYGLPMVMNYASCTSIRRSTKSEPVQGAVQPDLQRSPRLHAERHGHRHAEQRHAVFVPVDGPARRADRALGPRGREGPLLLGAARRPATPSTTATSAAAPPATRPADYLVAGPRLERREARRASRKCLRSETHFSLAVFRTQLFDPATSTT